MKRRDTNSSILNFFKKKKITDNKDSQEKETSASTSQIEKTASDTTTSDSNERSEIVVKPWPSPHPEDPSATSDNEPSKIVVKPLPHPDDPCLSLPQDRLERTDRLRRGPYQPRLSSYPISVVGTGKNARNMSFIPKWYDQYDWLEYSIEKNAVFCFPCRSFIIDNSFNCTLETYNTYVNVGFSNWRKAKNKFDLHQRSKCHSSSIEGWTCFTKNTPVDVQLDHAKQKELNVKEVTRLKNREYMTRLVDVVRTLAKGGKPLRGHDESRLSVEKGLFLEIVDLLLMYDPFFKSYHENIAKNATYTSNRIQNDILESLKRVILKKITDEVRDQPVALIGDETSDVSHHEQMAIVIRYIPAGMNCPVERFISLKRLKKTDAESIFDVLRSTLEEVGILWKNVLSVCFDGASAMSGQFNGVQAKCKEMNSSILYVHCYAHCLNLTLVAACSNHKSNPLISDFFGVLQLVYNFIEGSPKRHAVFEDMVKNSDQKLKTLKSLSETRWACRSEAVSAVVSQYENIIKAITDIVDETTDVKARATGKGLLHQMKNFNFIAALHIMNPILQVIVITSKSLQSADIDLYEAMEEVENVALALTEMRSDPTFFEEIYKKAEERCSKLSIDIPAPKKRRTSVLLTDDQARTTADNTFYVLSKKEELRLFTYYPVLDVLVQNLNDRFGKETKSVISAVGKIIRLDLDYNKYDNEDKILSRYFGIDEEALVSELRILKAAKKKNFPPKKVQDWLLWLSDPHRGATYNNFKIVLRKFVAIPVTSCSCERGFSKLSSLKSKLRSTMKQERLENLLLPYIEQELTSEVDLLAVVDEFKNMVPFQRRLPL